MDDVEETVVKDGGERPVSPGVTGILAATQLTAMGATRSQRASQMGGLGDLRVTGPTVLLVLFEARDPYILLSHSQSLTNRIK